MLALFLKDLGTLGLCIKSPGLTSCDIHFIRFEEAKLIMETHLTISHA